VGTKKALMWEEFALENLLFFDVAIFGNLTSVLVLISHKFMYLFLNSKL